MRVLLFLSIITLFYSCKSQEKKQLPNILWIITEDITTLSFCIDITAKTPNLDLLGCKINNDGKILLSTKTEGASIASFISENPNENLNFDSDLYIKSLKAKKVSFIYAKTQRIGFKESGITKTSI